MFERIKSIFQKRAPRYGHEDIAHVNRDWSFILIVFVVVIVLMTALNVRLFMRIDKGDLFVIESIDSTAVGNTIDEALLGYTLEFFEEKENRFERLKRVAPPIPSVR
ncbi:hypothetical protein IID27_01205 [Patescibacteria group bacterium]|nr:hypothetical protein [Patescibacteria group bacterium]